MNEQRLMVQNPDLADQLEMKTPDRNYLTVMHCRDSPIDRPARSMYPLPYFDAWRRILYESLRN